MPALDIASLRWLGLASRRRVVISGPSSAELTHADHRRLCAAPVTDVPRCLRSGFRSRPADYSVSSRLSGKGARIARPGEQWDSSAI